MTEDMESAEALAALSLSQSQRTNELLNLAGCLPQSISTAQVWKTYTIKGITIDDVLAQDFSTEFEFEKLKNTFSLYCEDFPDELANNVPSTALDFSMKVLFECTRFFRECRGSKAINFKFPYRKNDKVTDCHAPVKGGQPELSMKVVLVTNFNKVCNHKQKYNEKLILTPRQAGLLAMVTFSKALSIYYNQGTKLLTPLCGAIFCRDSISDMSRDLGIEEVECLKIINESATPEGQYLPNSDMACAIVCMITVTKKVTDKNIRNRLISKVVKQYVRQRKQYIITRFAIFSKYACGGVPPGLDPSTLIEMYNGIQTQHPSLRAQVAAIRQAQYEVIMPSSFGREYA